MPEKNYAELNALLEQQKASIDDLTTRLNQREQTIKDMTIAYLKDVQHMREMYTRKTENPELEIYEVSYYDVSLGMDPEVKVFIEKQVKAAIETCKTRLRD